MDEDVPCSSIAVESIIRIGTAGLIWGACAAPYDANRKGLIGLARASFVSYGFCPSVIFYWLFQKNGLVESLISMPKNCCNDSFVSVRLSAYMQQNPPGQTVLTLVYVLNASMKSLLIFNVFYLFVLHAFYLSISLGLFAGIFSYTRCGLQRYRRQNDWMNALVAGAVAGAVIGAGSRNWKQVAGMAGIISTFCAVADYSKPV
ncbi:hypothetical protein LguiB_030465 [Lonicera macranthoides]